MTLLKSVNRWRETLWCAGRAIYEDDCLGWAGELAFFWFLAVFPALLFVVAVAPHLPVQDVIDVAVGGLARVAPAEVLVLVREQRVQIAHGPPGGLLMASLLAALWSGSSAMTAIIGTLNQAYHVKEGRPWWRVRLLALGLTVVLVSFALIAVVILMIGPTAAGLLENRLGMPGRFSSWWAVARWPVACGLVVTGLGWVYYFAPNVRRRWVWITPGSVAATLLWIAASIGLKWYASRFGEYQLTYGSLGAVIVALLWLYVSGLAILVGAELNAAIEHTAAARQVPDHASPREPAAPGAPARVVRPESPCFAFPAARPAGDRRRRGGAPPR